MKNYDPKVKFTTWMYKIIVNLCYDKLKSEKRSKMLFENMSEEISELKSLSSTDLEKEFSNKETAMLIKYFSKELSEKQRIIFVLRDIEDFSINEVIEITGMSEASVKTNLFFARQNIRKKIIGLEK
jgi:RNA polymerase sigma-70 factor (ECF subfamily)